MQYSQTIYNTLTVNIKIMKMTFRDYGKSLKNEKADFVKEISELVVANEQTVYRWLSGEFVPSRLRQEVIANHLNTAPEILWPTLKKEEE